MAYVKGATFKKVVKVSNGTLREWADNGKIDFYRTPGGVRMYKLPDTLVKQLESGATPTCVCYVRVSSPKQKDDLERQRAFMQQRFPHHDIVADVGSGINWKRKGLLSILDRADKGDIREVVVASRDRLCRFAFELLEHVLDQRGVKVRVLDRVDTSPEEELSDDLLSIVQVFCCRKNGKRRYSQNAKDQAEPDQGAEGAAEHICAGC